MGAISEWVLELMGDRGYSHEDIINMPLERLNSIIETSIIENDAELDMMIDAWVEQQIDDRNEITGTEIAEMYT